MELCVFLQKLTVLVLPLCLAGCFTAPLAYAGTVASTQGQPIIFKKKFYDDLPIQLMAQPYLTKRASLTKKQAMQFGQGTSIFLSLVGKTLSTSESKKRCAKAILKAQGINLENYLKKQYGVTTQNLLDAYILTTEEAKQAATLITVSNCPNVIWPNSFLILRPKSFLESNPAWGTGFIFWKDGVLFRGASGKLL